MFQAGTVGAQVAGWQAASVPGDAPMVGHYVRLHRLAAQDAGGLWAVLQGRPELWTYMGGGPFQGADDFAAWIAHCAASVDPQFWTIALPDGTPVGMASYMRMDPAHGVIEIGNLMFSPALQGTPAATEAMTLMIDGVLTQGWRRCEWKCNALNMPSRRAAQRLGFAYEGIFRQHMVIKGLNRDTAWFSILDSDWRGLKAQHQAWLDPANFDANGQQIQALSVMTRPLLVGLDPGLAG